MRDKWVDLTDYFGPDRRRARDGSRRWKERRGMDVAGQLPALGSLLRRLRVQVLGLNTPEDRRHALQMLSAATSEAERMQLTECADALKAAAAMMRATAFKRDEIEAKLTEAMTLAAGS